MKQLQKAPNWAMVGVLALIILTSIPSLLLLTGIIIPETISFSNEYGESASVSVPIGLWIVNIIAIIYFIAITVLAFAKNWRKAVAIGAICLICANIAGVIPPIIYGAASSYEELRSAFELVRPLSYIEIMLYILGSLLITFNTSISNMTKILFAIFIVIFSLIFLIPFPPSVFAYISNTLSIIKPLFAVVLLYLCVTSRQSQKTSKISH